MSDDLICVGAIGGSYGVQGEVRLKSFCANPDDIETYSPLTTEDGNRAFSLAIVRPMKNGFVVRIAEVATKEEADALKGTQLFARREQLPHLPDDEFYYTDLVGLDVFDTGGASLGRVKSVQNHGASDLLEVHAPGATTTVLLPFTKSAVPTVDMSARRIIADPPEGLFDT
ncbi:ribosome maturation factor RimM [uncultured Tateyamaria sp.]|uniref:ribosome maturation factor RimM n=1 Tax=uncultured Tateyamaria sp. TaxID=455651 RepID=UPI00262EFABF|nr:ribosome maturation factor RimM [uncultured Tateyamaria sp.]